VFKVRGVSPRSARIAFVSVSIVWTASSVSSDVAACAGNAVNPKIPMVRIGVNTALTIFLKGLFNGCILFVSLFALNIGFKVKNDYDISKGE